jgi:hypothetical protein
VDSQSTLDLINRYSSYGAVICLSINVVFCLIHWKKLSIPFRRLFYFLIWSFIIEILARVFMQLDYNNLPLLHIYTLGEFILFSYFYKSLIRKPAVFQKIYGYFIVGCGLLIVLNSVFFQSIYEFNSYAKTFVQITIIGYAVLYFYNLIGNESEASVESKSLRLVNSAVIIYYSGSLFIFMYGKYAFENIRPYLVLWAFNSVLNIIFHLLILLGLWKAFFRKRTL